SLSGAATSAERGSASTSCARLLKLWADASSSRASPTGAPRSASSFRRSRLARGRDAPGPGRFRLRRAVRGAPVAREPRGEEGAGPAHAFREVDLRAVAEQAAGLRDVGERVAHVTRTGLAVAPCRRATQEVPDRRGDGEEAVARAAGHVEDLA